MLKRCFTVFFASLLPLIYLTGCGKSASQNPPLGEPTSASAAHTHEGWWCEEHGLPEEKCAMCNAKLAAELKAKGDWCAAHDRPDSLCFICHPELETKFAALYEAKYGTKPPPRKE